MPLALLARLRAGRLRLAGARPARRARHRAAQVAAEGDPPNVVPAADWARSCSAELPDAPPGTLADGSSASVEHTTNNDSLAASLAIAIKRLSYMPIEASDFDLERIPPHLRVTFRVVDEKGRHVDSSKDLRELQQTLKSRTRESVARVAEATPNALERSGITRWDFDELPRYIDTRQAGNVIRGYPALVDDGSSVSIRIMATELDQRRAMPAGVRRLLLLAVPSPVSYVQQHLTSAEKLTLAASPYSNTQALFDDCLVACVNDVLFRVKEDGAIFTRLEFETTRDRVSAAVMNTMFDAVSLVAKVLSQHRAVEKTLKAVTSMNLLPALTDAGPSSAALCSPDSCRRPDCPVCASCRGTLRHPSPR